jgi:hypothetical protein
LSPHHFNQSLVAYLEPAYRASDRGYAAPFVAVAIIALVGIGVTAGLVRPPASSEDKVGEALDRR